MRVCAGIVLHNPDAERLRQNIGAVQPQVDLLVLIDNASGGIDRLQAELGGIRCEWIKNDINRGVAGALNQLVRYAEQNGYDWVLTLDQDSICGEGLVQKLSDAALEHDNTAMVSPRIVERGTVHPPGEALSGIEEVPVCITSGCLTNVGAVLNTGGFDERLFIDHVDHDMCIRLRHNGYRVIRVNTAVLLQEYGQEHVRRRLFLKTVEYHNYTPSRVYYQTRNMLFMVRKYGKDFKPYPLLHFFRPVAVFAVKFVFEPARIRRLAAFTKGYMAGLCMKV
jgi:rhamnosyltransferase